MRWCAAVTPLNAFIGNHKGSQMWIDGCFMSDTVSWAAAVFLRVFCVRRRVLKSTLLWLLFIFFFFFDTTFCCHKEASFFLVFCFFGRRRLVKCKMINLKSRIAVKNKTSITSLEREVKSDRLWVEINCITAFFTLDLTWCLIGSFPSGRAAIKPTWREASFNN